MAKQEYRVLLVENDARLLHDMAAVVQETVGFQLAAAYGNVQDALDQGGIFCPDLILLDVDRMDDYGIIEEFRGKFSDGRLLCMGKKWSITLFRSVIRAGAGGFLVVPFSSVELINGVRSFEEESLDSKVIAFFSPKGKSGKTTFIANLAVALAETSQSRVGIIDADLQFGDMAMFFNLKPRSTITEAIRDLRLLSPATLRSYFIPVSDKVSVLCGTRAPEFAEQVVPDDFTALVQMARGMFQYILIDLPSAFRPISNAACEAADETMVMSMVNGGFEMEHMKRCLAVFKAWDQYADRVRVVFSRVEPCTEEARRYLEEQIDNPVYAVMPNEYLLVSMAANNGRIVSDIRSDSAFAERINAVAKEIYAADRRG